MTMSKSLNLALLATFTALVGCGGATSSEDKLETATDSIQHALSGYDYDGKDPASTGCDRDAFSVQSRDITSVYDYRYVLGRIDMMYSPSCGTNWGQTTRYVGTDRMDAGIERVYPSKDLYESNGSNPPKNWSTMVYGKGLCTYAWGEIDTGRDWGTSYTALDCR